MTPTGERNHENRRECGRLVVAKEKVYIQGAAIMCNMETGTYIVGHIFTNLFPKSPVRRSWPPETIRHNFLSQIINSVTNHSQN